MEATTRARIPASHVKSVQQTHSTQVLVHSTVPAWKDFTEQLQTPALLHVLVSFSGYSAYNEELRPVPPPILYYSWIVHKICEVQIVFSPSISQSVTPSGPPSPPEDLKSTPRLTAGSVLLTWRPPANTGGRTDIVYNVVCERCNGVVCAPCGGRVHFEPTHTSLSQPEVTVSELEPHINYTFKVEALNGVSHLSPQKSTASITTVLHFTGINFSSF